VNRAIAWFAENTVAANLLMVAIVAAGFLTLPTIRQEVFPEITTDRVTVSVPYPGAAPEEVEEGITVRIEEQLLGIDGIKRVTSTSSEGTSSVVAELYEDADSSRVVDDIKNRIDSIDTFPQDAEEPIVQELIVRAQVLNIAVAGDVEERTLKVLAQRVRDELTSLDDITHVEVVVARPYEISIEVSEDDLRRFDLTFDEVVAAVRARSVDLPGGSIKTRGGEILLRSQGQAYDGHDFASIPLRSESDGRRLLVGDVARVVDGFRDTDEEARFDGERAVLVQVFRVGEQNALTIADAVHEYVDGAEARMPVGVSLTIWQDDSQLLRGRRDLLLRNGRDGFVLVILVLALFLRARVALWVAVGVPIALLGTLFVLPSWGISINLLSLFAFIVVLGILVDDAIVTGENIFRHQEAGLDSLEAAKRGTQEIVVPVVFGVLTTMAAFAPMLAMPGAFGRIIRVIPAVVITALAFSLVESKLILPSHLGHMRAESSSGPRRWQRFQDAISRRLAHFVEHRYRPVLSATLDHRGLTLAIALAVVLLTAGYIASGRIQFAFFPKVEGDDVVALVTMPVGTPVDETSRVVAQLEETAARLVREADKRWPPEKVPSNARHVLATIGAQPYRDRQSRTPAGGPGGGSGGHTGEVHIELYPSEQRAASAERMKSLWRELTGPIPDARDLEFTASLISSGDAIHVQLRGPKTEALRGAAADVTRRLARYPGVFDIADSFQDGKRELKLRILPSAEAAGLTLRDLGNQVRQAFYGAEVQKIQRGRDELRVMVRYPEAERRSLGDIESMRIRLPDATAVPFSAVAAVELSRGFASIRHNERQRVIDVTADVDETQANANEIIADLRTKELPAILAQYEGVGFTFEGEQREQSDTFANFRRGSILSLIAIFALLAIPLRSYVQPLVVMSAIPFGFVGAVMGHVVTGRDLSMLSVIGILAAAGVVVNDSLVLVTFVNRRRAEGLSARESVVEAGVSRFRAILLTSLTTFLGLTPIMLERSLQAQFLIPMAISLAYGVAFATAVTLLVVPAMTLAIDDSKAFVARHFGRAPRRAVAR
jgi:multidrug efflux pump subunit AcrB